MTLRWTDEVDEVIRGDITAAAAYLTPAGGVVVSGVAPCGLADREKGIVAYTSSLAFSKKLERLIRNPRTALAFHAREHGFGTSTRFVLVDGRASVDLAPSRSRLDAAVPQVTRYLGDVRRGPVWDRLLHEYYAERVFIDISVRRVVVWPDLVAAGRPEVLGADGIPPAPPQAPPKSGTGPRVDVAKEAAKVADAPHRLVGFRGGDGFPVVVPVGIAGHDRSGIRLVASPGLFPAGGRRAGLLAHAYRPQLVGLRTRMLTGWLDVADDGTATYAPHSAKGFGAPPQKSLLLVTNGLFAKYGMWRAQRDGVLDRLEALQARTPSP